MRGTVLAALLGLAGLGACATTGADGEGDRDLPTAGVGPFRELRAEEVRGVAPFVLDDAQGRFREPSALVVRSEDGAEETLLLAAATREGRGVIVGSRARDARSFYGTSAHAGRVAPTVLAPDAAWEGDALSGPSLVRAPSGDLWLFYAGRDGIGVAWSRDGRSFEKHRDNPVLRRATDPSAAWESTAPRAPGAVFLPDGRLRVFYAAGNAIGEAEGEVAAARATLTRRGVEPVLRPSEMPPPGALRPNEKPPFDTAAVSDPCVTLRTTPAGRLHVRVLYTGVDAVGGSSIGFAARYGDTGLLDRQAVPVFSVGDLEAAPALVETRGATFLYVQQLRRDLKGGGYFAIGGAVAPAIVSLPAPGAFPDAP